MVIVRSSTEITHYLKIKGVDGSKPVVSGEVRKVFEDLQQQTIPEGIQRRLTFAMKLSEDHHCTICYVNKRNNDKIINCIENYLAIWEEWKRENYQFDIMAIRPDHFGSKSVILLKFESEKYNDLFQATSQQGTSEGGSVVRTPHLTYYRNETGESKMFILNILSQI